MKKILLFTALLCVMHLSAVQACSCEKPPSLRASLYNNYVASDIYVFLAFNVEKFYTNPDSAHVLVLQQYQYQAALDLSDTITHWQVFNSCRGPAPPLGDTVIAWMKRASADNPSQNIYTGYFYTDDCEVHYMRVENGMVLDWGPTPFPLTDFQDTLDAFNLNPGPGLSVDDVAEQHQLEIFPNPAGNEIQIMAEGIDIKEVKLYDVQGKQILHKSLTRNNTSLSTKDLSPGIYLVHATDKDGLVYRKKMLKR